MKCKTFGETIAVVVKVFDKQQWQVTIFEHRKIVDLQVVFNALFPVPNTNINTFVFSTTHSRIHSYKMKNKYYAEPKYKQTLISQRCISIAFCIYPRPLFPEMSHCSCVY